jgi:hypothetical protein
MPVTQVGIGNACGACAAIHVVEHIWGDTFAPKQTDVPRVWSKVKFDKAKGTQLKNLKFGDGTESDPFNIAKWLKDNHNLQCTLYTKDNSLVAQLLKALWNSPPGGVALEKGDGLDINNIGKAKCAIGIYSCPGGLHYLAIRRSGTNNLFIDSNYQVPTWKTTNDLNNINGCMKYTYAGGSINVA